MAYSAPFFEYLFAPAFVSFRVEARPGVAIVPCCVEVELFVVARSSVLSALAVEQEAPHNFFEVALSFPVWVKRVVAVHLANSFAPAVPFLC